MIKLNEQGNGSYEIVLSKSFDFENLNDFKTYLQKVTEDNAKQLLINFDQVEYIDSSALGMLMLAKHETDLSQCELRLCNVKNGHAKDVLHLVKFNQLFTIQES